MEVGNWEFGVVVDFRALAESLDHRGCRVVMQVALGAAWSVFRIPLTRTFGWTISQVTLTFTDQHRHTRDRAAPGMSAIVSN